MKTKILKVMGVVLTLAMVLSLFPVTLSAQAPTPTTPSAWVNVPIPGAIAGTFVVPSVPAAAATPIDCDFVVMANDGTTMYAVDNAGNNVLKSTNAGQTWIAVTPAAAAFPIHALAVAPDNPAIVALVDHTDIGAAAGLQWGDVYVSTDGGAIWAAMPRVSGLAAYTAGTAIMDLDISPAMPWGREYAVCTANGAAIPNGVGGLMAGDAAAAGNVIVYGTGGNPLGWADQGAPAEDYTSVAFTPGYAGYRVVVAVGSDLVDTALHIRNTSAAVGQWDAAGGFVGWPIPIADAASVAPTEAQIVNSGIAVPSDFDPSVATARRVYAYWNGTVTPDDDVYRIDDISVRRLNVLAGASYNASSMVYTGTRASGTLFVGDAGQAQVRRSADPFTALPTWTPATKPPSTGVAVNMVSGNTQVVLPPDYDTTNTVFAGTSNLVNPNPAAGNDESALSISHDGGDAFNQLSMIDTIIAALMDVTPVPDGDALFLATSDGAAAEPDSVWRSTSSPLGAVWERVDTMICDAGTAIVRVDPDYASTSAVYFAEVGGVANFNIHFSSTGGDLWASRFAPAAIADLLVESQDVVYAAIGTTVRRSTASGWSWDLPQDGKAGAITMLSLAPNGDILVGGTANVGYSQDGGSTFNQIAPTVGGGGAIQVVADMDYATNSRIYASSSVAGSGIFRWTVGTSTAWEPIRAVAGTTVRGLAIRENVLFGVWDSAGAPSGVERSLSPDAPSQVVAGTFFNTLNAGLGGAEVFNRAPQALKVCGTGAACTLFTINTAGAVATSLFTFNDDMALLTPEFDHPTEVFSDPVGGRNDAYTVSWSPISNATTYDYRVYADEGGTQQVYAQNLVVPANPAAPAIVVPQGNLIAGRTYYARFRVRNQTTAAANWTNWSAMTKFDVTGGEVVQVPYLGPQPLGPVVGATNVPVSGTALTWAPYARATKYEVKLATDAALTDVLGTAQVEGTAYQYDSDLSYSTTYFWAVRAIEPVPSDWSPTAHFTTMAEPVEEPEPEPPVVIEQPTITPAYIYAIIAVGALLVIAVLVLIVRTRRPM